MEELKTFTQREQEKAQMGDTEFKYIHDCPRRFIELEEDLPSLDDELADMFEYYGYGRIKRDY